jgi:hypothetical protein
MYLIIYYPLDKEIGIFVYISCVFIGIVGIGISGVRFLLGDNKDKYRIISKDDYYPQKRVCFIWIALYFSYTDDFCTGASNYKSMYILNAHRAIQNDKDRISEAKRKAKQVVWKS